MTRTPTTACAAMTALGLAACEGGGDGSGASGAELSEDGPYSLAAASASAEIEGYADARELAAAERTAAEASSAIEAVHDRLLTAEAPTEAEWLEVTIDGEPAAHPVWHHEVMPGAAFELSAGTEFAVSIDGTIVSEAAGSHALTAPDTPGVHMLRAFTAEGDVQQLTLFVLTPWDGDTVLEGYRIGTYPEKPPKGFIRLTQADMDAPVSPSFVIGQFICKQQPGHWPKFILTSEPMLKRLELLLENLREDGRTEAETFFIMSGFRTPFYNTAIGSSRLSRHMYGDASDIYPDVEGNDDVMDDLNNDGRITRADAEWLYDYAAELYANSDEVVPGGIGAYGANAVHGPFVHIDGRGRAARWGRGGS
ncbi:MAG: D-Ala-D-Ala carboxypeptidase family metallohydrolase [Oceanicaulis sp.]